MKLYAHKKTVSYFDYGSFLEREEGLCWSNGDLSRGVFGFERGDFAALLASKRECLPDGFQIIEGEPVERHCDLNPHGLI